MAGHGLRARRPAALTQRPFDAGALAAEVSPVACVDLDQAGDLLVSQLKQLGAGAPVTVVAHSRCPIRSPASCLMSFPDIRSDACW